MPTALKSSADMVTVDTIASFVRGASFKTPDPGVADGTTSLALGRGTLSTLCDVNDASACVRSSTSSRDSRRPLNVQRTARTYPLRKYGGVMHKMYAQLSDASTRLSLVCPAVCSLTMSHYTRASEHAASPKGKGKAPAFAGPGFRVIDYGTARTSGNAETSPQAGLLRFRVEVDVDDDHLRNTNLHGVPSSKYRRQVPVVSHH